ncbi:aldose epimerase family protein [Flavisolibacter ginsenosidimutans]|uniref:Aldose 1-epimerase n=1 Tax=Flavisolibacter ginsenosidimutans TaxID=661481 RepID=A0A5B8UJV8_9BACT|nr:aldose epimerase family protein [Flavisolibacter ginsenosidimutans]QEC56295.1 galactose mutarotase [Flavisolibacter ginsenosidimutans]
MQQAKSNSLSLRYEQAAQLRDKGVCRIVLQNGEVEVALTNLGCSILSIDTPDKNGDCKNIVAGFSSIEDYLVNRDYLGCVVGRYANRIANGRFMLDGKPILLSLNDGVTHLHGGVEGFHKKIWDVQRFINKEEQVGIVFSYLSRDGEEGYPGNLDVTVSYSLNKNNQLCIEYSAETDKATPVSLTNHSYFNLTGFDVPVIDDHLLQVNASAYTEKNEQNVPTGSVLSVEGTALDFRQPKKIGSGIDSFPKDVGYDHNFVLEDHSTSEVVFAAKLSEPVSCRSLTVFTSAPGIQVYTANYWDSSIKGVQGQLYEKHGAVALETQAFPDSPNQPSFPNTILYPGEKYSLKTIYAFGVE